MLLLEKNIWHCSHCDKSTWEMRSLTKVEDALQTWTYFQFATDAKDNFYGPSWYCNMFALNVKLHDEFAKRLRLEDRTLRKHMLGLASGFSLKAVGARAAIKLVTSEQMWEAASSWEREERLEDGGRAISVGQFRPWGIISMLMACFSLFNASLPLAAHVCKLRMVGANNFM